MIAVGEQAPDFTLDGDDGQPVSLSALRGQTVVLYFYPKDDTPGCNAEGCSFRDGLPRFEGVNAVVLGVSPDSVASHAKYKAKFGFPFTLLSDADHRVADQYGVWAEKSMYGRTYWGNARTTFVIGPDGRVANVFEKVKPEGHAEQVLAALGAS